jgi:ribonuclease VapC
VLAVLAAEPDSDRYLEAILVAPSTVMSAAAYVECGVVLDRHTGRVAGRQLDPFLTAAGIELAAFTPDQARLARAVYRDFGRGSGHLARLNFGDCFAYALAIERDEPLLFKGDDFGHTDVRSALNEA